MKANLTLLTATLTLLGGLFELYLAHRYSREYERLESRYPNHSLCTRASNVGELIYEFVPGKRCRANSLGFFDTERQKTKPAGTRRIALIGDSVAQGQGIPRDARFGNVLEDLLNSRPGAATTEVLNFARSGYSTTQELEVLERYALSFAPDLILFSYVLNDPAHPLFHDANGELGRYFYRPTWRGLHYVRKKVFQAREILQRRNCKDGFQHLLHCVYADEVETNFAKLARITQDRQIELVLILHPVLNAQGFDEQSRALHGELTDTAHRYDIPIIDLLDRYPDEPQHYATKTTDGRLDPWHPNTQGHAVAARVIFERLEPQGQIPHG